MVRYTYRHHIPVKGSATISRTLDLSCFPERGVGLFTGSGSPHVLAGHSAVCYKEEEGKGGLT